jgi:trimeric autotransporter adhesin
MPALNHATRGAGKVGAILTALILVAILLPGAALAAPASVTPATGGGAISADTALAAPGSGVYTSLTGPAVVEGAAGDLAAGTIVLDLPSGFDFLADSGTATKNAGCNLTIDSVVVTAAAATLTLSGTSSTTACTITFSGLRVRPTVGTPLQSGTISNTGSVGPGGNWGALQEVAGAPVLSFSQQPSATSAAATAFTTQPIVLDRDKFDNVRGSDAITLAITAGTGAPGAALTCTTNPVTTNSSGLATFAGCKIDKSSAIAYTLRATSSVGGTSATSSAVSITPGTASKLGFVVQPARGVPGTAFQTQPQVAVLDANNNVVFTDSGRAITLAIQTGGGSLTCTANPVNTSNGIASFAGCRISVVGVGDVLRATSPSLTLIDSAPFDVADRLGFATQPSSSVTAGVAFSTQPIVHVRAGASNRAVNDDATVVTLSLKSGTGATGATLTCDSGLSRTVAAGIATFTGCKIDKVSPVSPSNPYVIVASASNLSSAESTNVAVIPGAAAKLSFTAQPTTATSSQAFAIQPIVAVQDLGGNIVTSGANSNATVTLGIGSNPAAGTLTCTSGLTRTAVAGVATFSGCQINNAGAGYTLTATATGLTGATSTAFTVSAPLAQITLTTSSSVITWGRGIVLTTQFGSNGGTKAFQLQGARDNATWATIATLTTDSTGRSSYLYYPVTNLYYRAVFAGTPDLQAANSPAVRTVVRQIAIMRPTNGGAVRSIARNTSITFTTTVRPARPELARARVSFYFYRLSGGSYVLRAKRDVLVDAAGQARTTFRFTSPGRWYVRSVANPTPYNANSVPTPKVRYSVR